MKKNIFLLGLLLLVFTCPVYALTIEPGHELYNSTMDQALTDADSTNDNVYPVWTRNNQPEIEASLLEVGIDITSPALYTNEISTEEGMFLENYDAKDWVGGLGGESGVTLYHTGGKYITNADYLLVKDGDNQPSWYLFSLAGWGGNEDIVLRNFWDDPNTDTNENGSISHFSIYGTAPIQNPEPATMLLFGFGLLGVAGISRRKN